jgi:hypothetical protein
MVREDQGVPMGRGIGLEDAADNSPVRHQVKIVASGTLEGREGEARLRMSAFERVQKTWPILLVVGLGLLLLLEADLLANCPADNEQQLDRYGQIGKSAASNLIVPIMPILRPKLRKVARRPFSMAMAFD